MADRVPIPPKMVRLPRDSAGRPVPYFAAHVDGHHDFRVIDPRRLVDALRLGACWVCGQTLGANKVFVVGPMCVVNRVSSEPPSHRDCALYSAQACPFLTTPGKVRREANLPDDLQPAPGGMLEHNPGVTALYFTRRFEVELVTPNAERGIAAGVLVRMGEPSKVLWMCQGGIATRKEVEAAMDRGLPALRELAEQDGYRAVDTLETMVSTAKRWLP